MDSLVTQEYRALSYEDLVERLAVVDDRRIWVIAEACHRGMSYDLIHDITKIDRWFIDKIAILVEMERRLISEPLTPGASAQGKTDRVPGRRDRASDRKERGLCEKHAP